MSTYKKPPGKLKLLKTGADDFIASGRTRDDIETLPSSQVGALAGGESERESDDYFTDVRFARMLAQSAKQRIRYCEARGCWYVYDGKLWAQGSGNLVKPFVHDLARTFHDRAGVEQDSDKRKRYRINANKLETDHVIRAVINQAMGLDEAYGLKIDPTKFDRRLDLLNVLNGTIDLTTGKLLDHDPEHFLSLIASVDYVEGARSELWEQTVALAMHQDQEMIDFLHRVYGYIVNGSTKEKRFFDEYGPTDTGKTTINDSVAAVLGGYAKPLRVEALQVTREPEKIPHELAAMMGVRLGLVSEVPPGTPLNQSLIKKISGGDPLSVSFKYGREFFYHPQFTLVLYSNDRVQLTGTDEAIWSRNTSIPFTFNFKTDTEDGYGGHIGGVADILREPEHQRAILSWLVEGAVIWHRQGLAPIHKKVLEDSQAHRAEVDSVAAFIRERCEEGPGLKVSFLR